MAKDINLLPDVTLKEEKEGKTQKLLTVVSMAILIIGVIAVIAVFTVELTVVASYKKVVDQNTEKKKQVVSYATVELTQREIKSKLSTSNNVIKAAKDYKTITENIRSLVPEGIALTDISMDKANKVTVNGKANNSESFKSYITNLLDPEKGVKYFTDINLGNIATTTDGSLQFNLTMNLVKTSEATK